MGDPEDLAGRWVIAEGREAVPYERAEGPVPRVDSLPAAKRTQVQIPHWGRLVMRRLEADHEVAGHLPGLDTVVGVDNLVEGAPLARGTVALLLAFGVAGVDAAAALGPILSCATDQYVVPASPHQEIGATIAEQLVATASTAQDVP